MKILVPMLFADSVFHWCIIPHTTVSKHTRKFTTLQCRNNCTSRMAAVTVVNRMT